MRNNQEKQILNIIKYSPPLFIVIASILITLFLFFDSKSTFIKEKNKIESEYILENKKIIKNEVEEVYTFIKILQKNTEKELKESIRSRVYEAHSMATGIYNTYKDTKSKEEIFELIKVALNDIRYNNGRGYYFLDDVFGNKLLYPIDKKLENKNLLNFKDANGYKFMETMVQTIKDKTERFDEYFWFKPNEGNKSFKKLSFYKYFEPYNVVIGTGEYVDEYEKIIKKKILQYINLIRYNKTGYIFVLDYNGTYLSHFRKEYLNKNSIVKNNINDMKDTVLELLKIAKVGSGYKTYVQDRKVLTNIPTRKTSYVQGIKEWSWMIGTGFYEDDMLSNIKDKRDELDKKFEEYVSNIIIISFLLTIILLLVSIYISKLLESKFNEYKENIKQQQNILAQQSKMAAMGEMIGNIAHQWRQPLSTITTASTGMVLQKELGVLTDEQFYESSTKINTSAQHLSKTIDDFRNFFSPNKTRKNVLIKNVFAKTLDLLQAQFHSLDIKIVRNIENVELNTIENELIQALINILNNAKDELVKKEQNEIRIIFIDVLEENKKLVIRIKDNAGGIPLEYLDRVFEPYFTTKHKSQGTGIGLYMTEEIIVKHLKGTITAMNKDFIYHDKSCKGAVFTITLDI